MRNKPKDTAAIVVTYRPAISTIRNIRALASQVNAIFVIDNTPGSGFRRVLGRIAKFPQVRIVRLGVNTGVGAALNIGMQLARGEGFDFAFTFDQDSFLTHGAARKLRQLARIENVAIAAPAIRDTFTHSPILRRSDVFFPQDKEIVITSGNLVNIKAWESIRGFDWQLFLDAVDFDFCLRLAKRGWLILRSDNAYVLHRLGRLRKIEFLNLISKHVRTYPPFRRYFQARNAVTMLKRHSGFARIWSLEYLIRTIMLWLKITLVEPECATAWKQGLLAGLRKRDYPIFKLEPFEASDRPTHIRLSSFTLLRLGRSYKRRLDELSTFPSR